MKLSSAAIGICFGAILTWAAFSLLTGLAESPPPPAQFIPPPQASEKIEGVLIKIDGRYFVVKDMHGKYVRLLITEDTQRTRPFKPGDRIVAWTAPVEHAMAIRAMVQPPDTEEHIEEPSEASRVVRGVLKKIHDQFYVIRDSQGKEVRVQISEDTEMAGEFSPGERIEVFLSPLEHAIAIRSLD